MKPVKVDEHGAVHLEVFKPGEYYRPEIVSPDEITLHRISGSESGPRRSRAEVIRAIEASPLRFKASWDELRQETRE